MKSREVKPGRRFLLQLPHGEDIITSLVDFCGRKDIKLAASSLAGAVSCYTVGTLDPRQQVYVTDASEEPREIVACSGTVTFRQDAPFVHAHVVLSDDNANTKAGHLLGGIVFAAEVHITTLNGPGLERKYDDVTGLSLWQVND